MIRLILTNGSSFTEGVGRGDPSTEEWPVLLDEMFGVDRANLARFTSSSRRPVRSALQRRRSRQTTVHGG